MKDWRLDLLDNVSDTIGMHFVKKKFVAQSLTDHIHCSICFKTIGTGNIINETYGFFCAESGDWLCHKCFSDFRNQFDWKLM